MLYFLSLTHSSIALSGIKSFGLHSKN
ncbi:hypothetical protein BC792_101344, partial [Sphingobacterium allocomposti]